MCTVSIISLKDGHGGYRLVTNRDEQRSREPAIAPAWGEIGGVLAIAPRDPRAGGTWVATTEAGLTLCLLNGNMEPAPALPQGLRSRGAIIPTVIGCGSLAGVREQLQKMDLSMFAPFRLVGVGLGCGLGDESGLELGSDARSGLVLDAFWDRTRLTVRTRGTLPLCFVSSGLGDSRVLPRLPLFDEMVGSDATPVMQDAYHAHVWPERPEISVCMSRADARTVSTTVIEVRGDGSGAAAVRVAYTPILDPS